MENKQPQIIKKVEPVHCPHCDGMVYIDMQTMMPAILGDRKSTRLNSSHTDISRMPSSA